MVQVVVEHNTGHPRLAALLHEHATRQPELRNRVGDMGRRVVDALAAHIVDPDLVSEDEWSRRRLRAHLCVRLVDHLVHSVPVEPPLGVEGAVVIDEVTGSPADACATSHGTRPLHHDQARTAGSVVVRSPGEVVVGGSQRLVEQPSDVPATDAVDHLPTVAPRQDQPGQPQLGQVL